MHTAFDIRAFRRGDGPACERILRALPDWFGIERALVAYVNELDVLDVEVVEIDGTVAGFFAPEHAGHASSW